MGVEVALAVASLAAGAYSANEQRKAGKKQSRIASDNAARERAESEEAARRHEQAQGAQLSEAKARAAASGVKTSGSQLGFLERLEESQGKELDWMKTSGASRASIAERTGKVNASITSSGALGSLMQGAGQAYSYWNM